METILQAAGLSFFVTSWQEQGVPHHSAIAHSGHYACIVRQDAGATDTVASYGYELRRYIGWREMTEDQRYARVELGARPTQEVCDWVGGFADLEAAAGAAVTHLRLRRLLGMGAA